MTPQEMWTTALDQCISPHVALAERRHVRLEWHASSLRIHRTRSLAWTCDCRATVYELCAGGGQAFIRRTVQLDDGHQIHEIAPSSTKDAWELWTALLTGAAR
jgi:hypothetical protein